MCQTGVAVGMDLEDKMPYNEYYEYFGPDYTLHVTPSNMENQNSRAYLDTIRERLLQNLSTLQHVPSVPFYERPPDTELPEDEDEEMEVRHKGRVWDSEMSDSDSEERRHQRRHHDAAVSEAAFPRSHFLSTFFCINALLSASSLSVYYVLNRWFLAFKNC